MPQNNSQYRILPEDEARFYPTLDQIPLSRIDGEWLEPDNAFVESVRAMGIIQPIAVRANFGGSYTLIAGRRRVSALRTIFDDEGNVTVPALVFPVGTPPSVAAAMTLTENVQRRANPLTDLESIEELVRQGASEEDIARQLHLSRATVRSRMRLGNLIGELREGLSDGLMSASTAERAARLDHARQARLAGTMAENGRLTSNDVTEVLRARQEEYVQSLPVDLFNTFGGSQPLVAGVDWGRAAQEEHDDLFGGEVEVQQANDDGTFIVTPRRPRRTEELRQGFEAAAEAARAMGASAGRAAVAVGAAAPVFQSAAQLLNVVPLPELDDSGLPTEHSWNGVLRCLQRAEQLFPAPTGGDDERLSQWLQDLIELVRGRMNAS